MKLGYARVSTTDQHLELQTDALTKAGAERIYKDRITGAKFDRVGLDEMLKTVRPGDCVIVWRLDRLARSLKHLIELAEQFDAGGVQLVSLHENIDTTTPAGKLFFQINGAFAEFERNLIRERTVAGLDAARTRGKIGGRKPTLDKAKQETIDLLIEAANVKGLPVSVSSIARSVGVNERTVRRYVKGEYAPKQLEGQI